MTSCSLWFKDTNLKANHNLNGRELHGRLCCSLWFKDTNLKANHNKPFFNKFMFSLFFMVQRY